MHCPRCRCNMIHEKSFTLGRFLYLWHCLICGGIYAPVIVLNHLNQQEEMVFLRRKARENLLDEEMF
jgi:hypothetical protein